MNLGGTEGYHLDHRRRRILYALITEYIATGEPVGSRTLAKRYGLNLSPASIRNVLSDLEDDGFLCQPHTSAGRIPTDQGFRVFVDALVRIRDLSTEQREAIIGRLRDLEPGRENLLREAGRLLSTLTGAAAVISAPRPETELLAQLRFMRIRAGLLLAVIVTHTGAVQNRLVETPVDLESSELERLNNYLHELAVGKTLIELRNTLQEEMAGQRPQVEQLRQSAKTLFDALDSPEGATEAGHVIIEGEGLLFDHPEFEDASKIRAVLRTFQEKERILEVLEQTLLAGGVQVLIGSEANLGDIANMSVVSAGYQGTSLSKGSLGIIGPIRMDYAKVVPIVGFTAQVMSTLLDASTDEDNPADEH